MKFTFAILSGFLIRWYRIPERLTDVVSEPAPTLVRHVPNISFWNFSGSRSILERKSSPSCSVRFSLPGLESRSWMFCWVKPIR